MRNRDIRPLRETLSPPFRPAVRVALLGFLCALAVVGRVAMAPLPPNVQPVTVLLMLIALFFGAGWSMVCSAAVVLVTNLFLGMGIWTLYQIAAWALIGLVTGLLFRYKKSPVLLTAWAMLMGYAYGFLVSLFAFRSFVTAGDNIGFWAYYLSGLLADTFHALGNGVFMWILLPLFTRLFAPRTKKTQPPAEP